MIRKSTFVRFASSLAVMAALTLTGCGGGAGMHQTPPTSPTQASSKTRTMATLSTTVPTKVVPQSAARKAATAKTTRNPAYLDTSTANSAIVVSVTPADPAEAAEYGNFTQCYPLYVNGTVAANNSATGFSTSTSGGVTTVTLAFPAPPGEDTFTITQYQGSCVSGNPYTVPSPTDGILAQSPPQTAYLTAGTSNSINAEISACTTYLTNNPTETVCPANLAPGANTPILVDASVASIAIPTSAPITDPVRESGSFLTATGKIGVPIPLEGLNAAGAIIAGAAATGAGPYASGVSLAVTTTPSTAAADVALELVDAKTGTIAQGPSATVTIHQFNELTGAAGVLTPVSTTTAPTCTITATASTCNDIQTGSTAVAGDPYVIVLTYTGVGAASLSTITVTATPGFPATGATQLAAATYTVTPQSAVWTASGAGGFAAGTGYTDLATPTKVSGVISAGSPAVTYLTDGTSVKIDGTASVGTSTATALTGLTYATWGAGQTFVYAVDNGQANATHALEAGPVASGVWAFASALGAAGVPVAAQAGYGSANFVVFDNPVGVVEATGADGNEYLYVADTGASGGELTQLDIETTAGGAPVVTNGFETATNVTPGFPLGNTASGGIAATGLSFGSASYIQMLTSTGTPAGTTIYIPDPGNQSIDTFNVKTSTFTAGGLVKAGTAPFTGLYATGTGYYATTTTGQIYSITSAGVATSLGFTLGTAVDGPLGQVQAAPTTTPVLTATTYPLQGQANNFFNLAAPPATIPAPYSLAPFNGTAIFSASPAAAIGLVNDTSSGLTTGAGVIKATGGIIYVPATATLSTYVTPNSFVYADATGKLRTIVL